MNAKKINEILDDIDKILSKADDTACTLWNILTAMRGPDDGDFPKKFEYTVPIRGAAFPLTAKNMDKFGENVADISRKPLPTDTMEEFNHYNEHINLAIVALHRINRTPYNK